MEPEQVQNIMDSMTKKLYGHGTGQNWDGAAGKDEITVRSQKLLGKKRRLHPGGR